MSVNARNHRLILLNYHSGSDVILNMSWLSTNQIDVDRTPNVYSTYPFLISALLLIPCLGIHNSFAIELWISQLFLSYDLLAFFLLLVEYRCSHQIPYGPPDPLLDFIWQRPSYSITLWAFPQIHNAFGKLYPLLSQPCVAFELVWITPGVVVICF